MAQAQPSRSPWPPAPSTTPAPWNRSASLAARSLVRAPSETPAPLLADISTPQRVGCWRDSPIGEARGKGSQPSRGVPISLHSRLHPACLLGGCQPPRPLPLWACWKGDRVLPPKALGTLAETPGLAPAPARGTVRVAPEALFQTPHAGHSTHSPRTLGPRAQAGVGVGGTFIL